ncbi:MAG: hypothetical protein JST98_09825, partial [Bacteroidetes bacterium]|nr:hypothetical protein [Bacteroidota bacterium]
WNGSSMVGTATTASTSQTPAQSGGDWWYDVVEIKENGVVTGYVAVGYSGAPNWGYDDGCFTKTVDDLPKEANDGPLENNGNRHGEIRGAVARYRLDGTLDWYHSFYGGALMGVIQDSQGKLVMVGSAANSHADYFDDIVSPPDLALNPVSGSNTTPICTTGTAKRQMVVMKMNIDGSLEWNYLYNPEATAAMASLRQTDGMDLVETPLTGGAIGYRVVGDAARSNGAGGFDAGKQRPYIVQLDVSGNKLWDHYYGTLAGPGGWDEVQEGAISATAIDRAAIGGNSYYAVTGTVIGYDPAQTNGELFPAQAWLMYFNEPAAASGYQAFSTYTTAQQVGNISGSSKSNDVKIREEANVPVVYWPVIGNLHGVPWAGVHYAEHGYVYKLPWNGTVPTASADLGELHAFDLQLGICTTADGNILATATKWPPGKSVATGNNYGYTDLTQAQVDALTAYRPGYNWNPALPPSPWATWYSFWGTQSYLAKLNGTDLSLVWDHQWTHGYSTTDDAFAGNLRRRQCNFKVLEGQHGEIVVCGNTGHNFDDAYLAKLSPCENSPVYANLPLDANGEYHITAGNDETWTMFRSVQGKMVVDGGATLTIDGATIAFAPTTPQLTTNITVLPGGTLDVRNNAVLTSVNFCSGPVMWDGVKVLGNGTTVGAGLVHLESHAKIANAQLAIRGSEGAPTDPFPFFGYTMAGGIIHAEDAIFENNRFSIALSHHEDIDPAVWGPSTFTRCQFITDMDYPISGPSGAQVVLNNTANVPMESCTFKNTSGLNPAGSNGIGIHAINTSIKATGGTTPEEHGQFIGFDVGILHSTFAPDKLAKIDACDFSDNAQGVLIAGANNSRVTNCTFIVPDKDVTTGLGLEGAYGTYIYGCSGFEFEQNTFTGAAGGAYPKVGAVFYNTGIEDNMFYNNTFNGFTDQSQRSAGTIIMGENAAADGTGLRIKCNDYSATSTNDYDVAFTGDQVSIATEQGAQSPDNAAPAGNTWANVDALTCNGNEAQHFYVEHLVNVFTYWHHAPQPGIELVPHCSIAGNTTTNTGWPYLKPQSCPVDLSELVPLTDDGNTADNADLEYATLKDVYSNWKDGGNTDRLIDYIRDPLHSSYDVRNQLMLVAPKVGLDAWKEVFHRFEPMNPWHIAQALLANSPLEPAVMKMMEESDLTPFYKDLVTDGQTGGVSMHSIYKSEIAHFYAEKATALQAMVRKSLLSGSGTDRGQAKEALNNHYILSKDKQLLTLYIAAGTLAPARTLVDAQLPIEDGDQDYWRVQDLWLQQLENGQRPEKLDAAGMNTLEMVAQAGRIGAAQADAWLELLGQRRETKLVLPAKNRAPKRLVQHSPAPTRKQLLAAYPNPATGPFYLVYKVPEGVEQVVIRLHDAQGRLVREDQVAAKNGIEEVASKDLAEGSYFATLIFDGIQVGSTKVNILR